MHNSSVAPKSAPHRRVENFKGKIEMPIRHLRYERGTGPGQLSQRLLVLLRISGPAPFSFLKWLLIFYLTWFRLARQNFIFQAIRKKKQISVYLHFFILFSRFRSHGATLKHKRALSQDVTVATLGFQNNETTAILVFQSNPAIVVFFPYEKAFLCFNTELT